MRALPHEKADWCQSTHGCLRAHANAREDMREVNDTRDIMSCETPWTKGLTAARDHLAASVPGAVAAASIGPGSGSFDPPG